MRTLGGRSLGVVLFFLAACSSPDAQEVDECGPNVECAPGLVCDPVLGRCVKTGGGADANLGAPETVLDSKPPATSDTGSASFTFSSPTAGTIRFECSLDDAAFTACTSPKAYT